MADIFLSHSSEDRERVRTLVQALESQGWSVWWDRKIPPGKTWDQMIEQALNDAKCVIVVWSQNSIKSDWVHIEAEEGKRRQVLFPVLIDDIRPPLSFRLIQAVRLIGWQGETSHSEFSSLVESIKATIGRAAVSESQPAKEVIRQRLHLDEAPKSFEQALEHKQEFPQGMQVAKETSLAEKTPSEEHREPPSQPTPTPFIPPSHRVPPRETVEPVQTENDRPPALPGATSAIETEPVEFSSPKEFAKDDQIAIQDPVASLELAFDPEETSRTDLVATPVPAQSRSARPLKLWLAIGSAVVVIGIVIIVIWNSGGGVNKISGQPQLPAMSQAPATQTSPRYFTEQIGDAKLEMVEIPGGTFLMGSPDTEEGRRDDESPQHQVTVRPFAMGKFEVTQAQWRAVAGLQKVKLDLKPAPSNFSGGDLPVERVSWNEAVEFCARLSRETSKTHRLPSEAEWEYACRAETTGAYAGDLNAMAWYDVNSGGKTHPAGQKQPNAFGLYDMHGNVWEWCEDAWHDNYQKAPTDGSSWLSADDSSRRVLRGGSWRYYGNYCRSAYRNLSQPGNRLSNIGFRVVMSAR